MTWLLKLASSKVPSIYPAQKYNKTVECSSGTKEILGQFAGCINVCFAVFGTSLNTTRKL